MTPLDKVEILYRHLIDHYGEGEDRELRAASKLLMVALPAFKAHGGSDWHDLLMEYAQMLDQDPSKYERMLARNRSDYPEQVLTIPCGKAD